MMEMFFIHPQSYNVLWSNSVSVYGMQKKNTGIIVFNISPMEPALDSFQSQFLINFRYKVDQGEIQEIKTSCDLLSPKIIKGDNSIFAENDNFKLAINFIYLGYNDEKNSFGLK